MKKIITTAKKVLKRALLWATIIAVILAAIIVAWEVVRPSIVTEEVHIIERVKAEQKEMTDYDHWLASDEVRDELELMFMKHKREELDEEIAAREGLL